MSRVALVLLVLTSITWCISAQSSPLQTLFNQPTSGQVTFYGSDSGGTCMINDAYQRTLPTVAIGDFGNAEKCGMCVKITPTGTGSGNSDFPKRASQVYFVNNQCPECGPNNLDIAQSSDGRWGATWQAVPCPVDTSAGIQLMLKSGSSVWHTEIQARNFIVPIQSLKYFLNNQWVSLERKSYNFFYYDSPVNGLFPIKVQLVSIFGETLETTLESSQYNIIQPNLINTGLQFTYTSATPPPSTPSTPPSTPSTPPSTPSTPSTPPSTPSTPPPSTPPSTPSTPPSTSPNSALCSGVSAAYDPTQLWWVEVYVPGTPSSVQVQCTSPTLQTIPCSAAWGKYQCGPKAECAPDSDTTPRYAIVDGTSCRLSQYIPREVAGDSTNYNDDSSATIPASPNSGSVNGGTVAGIVVGIIVLVVIVAAIAYWRWKVDHAPASEFV